MLWLAYQMVPPGSVIGVLCERLTVFYDSFALITFQFQFPGAICPLKQRKPAAGRAWKESKTDDKTTTTIASTIFQMDWKKQLFTCVNVYSATVSRKKDTHAKTRY